MIDGLEPYPAMKDSGVTWLGEVPEHWEVQRLGALLRERGEMNFDNSVTEDQAAFAGVTGSDRQAGDEVAADRGDSE